MDSLHLKTVYFVRHGQSEDNVSPVFQATSSPLSKRGEAQADAVANRLTKVDFEALIASPVLRAKQTAKHIAKKTQKDIIYSDLFVERIKPKEIEGKPWTDEAASKIWREWNESLYTPSVQLYGGEGYDQLLERVDNALEFLLSRPESTFVVVTHGYFLRAIVARVMLGENLTGTTMKRFQEYASIENIALTVLSYKKVYSEDYAWRLWTLNDHAHFAD